MKQLLRLLAKNKTTNLAATDDTIYVYGPIFADFGVDPLEFAQAVSERQGKHLNIRFNTPGGDVFAARAMQAALVNHKGGSTAWIDGVAASCGSWLPMSCGSIKMMDGAQFMIHDPWSMAIGSAEDLRKTAQFLDEIKTGIVADYVRRTGLEAADLSTWMTDETWMNAELSKERGFVDEIYSSSGSTNLKWDLSAYKNAPKVESMNSERELMERRLRMMEIG